MTGFYLAMPDEFAYQWSDAWLLLSIIYASREHPASFGEILMLGDYINHTSFTTDEIEGASRRLKAGEWISGRLAEGYLASEKTLKAYGIINRKGLSAREELKEIELLLGIKNAS